MVRRVILDSTKGRFRTDSERRVVGIGHEPRLNGAPAFGPVVAGMAWFLVLASIMFFRLLLVRLGDPDDPA